MGLIERLHGPIIIALEVNGNDRVPVQMMVEGSGATINGPAVGVSDQCYAGYAGQAYYAWGFMKMLDHG
jgi:hypothetical protein